MCVHRHEQQDLLDSLHDIYKHFDTKPDSEYCVTEINRAAQIAEMIKMYGSAKATNFVDLGHSDI